VSGSLPTEKAGGSIGGGTIAGGVAKIGYSIAFLDDPSGNEIVTIPPQFMLDFQTPLSKKSPWFAHWKPGCFKRGLDYIVTNEVDRDTFVDSATSLRQGNGKYRIDVLAYDIQGGPIESGGAAVRAVGNEAVESRTVMVCNPASVARLPADGGPLQR
jgi:hypothetical protein